MPMIDLWAPSDLFPANSERELAQDLALALLKAEGVTNPGPLHLNNTGAYIHFLPPSTIHTAAQDKAKTVRIQVLTPPGALNRDAQKMFTREATEMVARVSGDPTQAGRTWVLLSEAAEGGWGIAGNALGKEEFQALAAKVST
jgi:phenylpyruvate tautomerase PptA (4-oxalocrotonate tautomerase family)